MNFKTLKLYQKDKYLYEVIYFLKFILWASGIQLRVVVLWGCTEVSRKYTASVFKVDRGNLLLQNFGAHKRLRDIINRLTTI